MRCDESGRSMIEMLGVIAIIGVLTVGGIAGYSKAMEKWRINKTANQISYIVARLRNLYQSQYDFHGLDSSTSTTQRMIDKTQTFPQEMGKAGDYSNPFAGKVTVKVSGRDYSDKKDDNGEYISRSDNRAFVLTYTMVPREACMAIATLDWGSGSVGGLVALGINYEQGSKKFDEITTLQCVKSAIQATPQKLGSMIICEGDGIMSPADASIGCSSEGNNTLYFKFY